MKPKCRGASFTLVEMLVSIAVFSLLVLLLFGIMSGATKLWRQQTSEEESFREARAALTVMSRDIKGALISTNTAWFYCNNTSQLAFLTTLPNSAQNTSLASGDICAVGYSLEYSTNDASSSQLNMSLYRYVCFSNPTYTNFIQPPILNNVSTIFSNPDGTNTVRQLIARDVPQVSFALYTNDATGAPWTSNQAFLSNMTINVGLTIVNNKTATLLTTKAQWQAVTSPLIQQNQETFALRMRPQVP